MESSNSNDYGAGLEDYYQAFFRIVTNTPRIVPKDQSITRRLVALEANRSPGSIKSSRDVYDRLIQMINEAANSQTMKKNAGKVSRQEQRDMVKFYKNEARCAEQLYRATLARELLLFSEIEKRDLIIKKHSNVVDFPGV